MKALSFLSRREVAEAEATKESPVAVPMADRFFRIHEELQGRFPGTEIKVVHYRSGDYVNLECEITGKRPSGAVVSFKVECKSSSHKPDPRYMEKWFQEIDKWE